MYKPDNRFFATRKSIHRTRIETILLIVASSSIGGFILIAADSFFRAQ
tara:strand:- start:301 stop:444 length:144 start_codon:yes stop_codon:yes gene_type:complete